MARSHFFKSVAFALRGILLGAHDRNFRIQLALGVGALGLLSWFRPEPLWWVAVAVVSGGVLSSELVNTALESLADALHPELHPLIGKAKDCAAGAVLVWSFISLLVLAALLCEVLLKAS